MKSLRSKGTKIISTGGKLTRNRMITVYSTDEIANINYPDLPIGLQGHRTLKVNSFVYCVGGKLECWSFSKRVFRLDLNEADLQWEEVAQMDSERGYFGATVFNDNLVVL